MPKMQVVQHRERREERNMREIADLKRQNQALKRRMARLEAELEKARDLRPRRARSVPVMPVDHAADERMEELRAAQPARPKGPVYGPPRSDAPCPRCGEKALHILFLGQGTWAVCKNCDFRTKTAKEGPRGSVIEVHATV